jgi:hypothetical protein
MNSLSTFCLAKATNMPPKIKSNPKMVAVRFTCIQVKYSIGFSNSAPAIVTTLTFKNENSSCLFYAVIQSKTDTVIKIHPKLLNRFDTKNVVSMISIFL